MILLVIGMISSIGLWVFLQMAPQLNLVDHPNERSLHSTPTVVSGGVVPMALLALSVATTSDLQGGEVVSIIMAGLVVIGLLDDRWGIATTVRLICYLAAGIALPWMVFADFFTDFALLLVLGVGVGVAWCINLVNFMDGADGFVTTQALCVATGLGLIAVFGGTPNADLSWLCALLFACCAPMLWFNWPPAKLFMGDAGAIPLGFFLALLGLMAVATDPLVGAAWFILMMPFLIDTGVTLCIRTLSGKPPHVAHRDHAYQRLALLAGGPLSVSLGLLAMQVIWLFPLAVTAVSGRLFPALLVLLSAIPSVVAVVYARRRA